MCTVIIGHNTISINHVQNYLEINSHCLPFLGFEILYQMYNPTIQTISVLKLEKRLDETLRYLRDAPPEYSTFPFDMIKEARDPDAPVPVNTIKVIYNSIYIIM